MSKKAVQQEFRPLKTNLLQQNCYLRDVTTASASTLQSNDTYVSVDEEVVEKDIDGVKFTGIELKYSVNPYPITPQSVNSYVDSADYRRDPVSAVVNGHHRKNLGDITGMQEVMSMDSEQARVLYQQLAEKFAAEPPKAEPPKAEPPKGE